MHEKQKNKKYFFHTECGRLKIQKLFTATAVVYIRNKVLKYDAR